MIDLGLCKTIVNQINLLHIVNLTEYETSFDKISHVLRKLEPQTILKTMINISNQKLDDLERNLNLLLPIRRQKRGIINGIGTAIKFITGNMDSEDAKTIYTQLNKLQSEESKAKQLYSKSHILNNEMIERQKNITTFINNQQNHILHYLDNISNQLQRRTDTIKELQYISQINHNIDSLNNHLKDITEAVSLAKVNIISKHIFNIEEIREISYVLEKENIRLVSHEHLYNLLELQAFYNNSNIVFNIKIPQINKADCELYNIFPLPINHTKKIVTKPYLTYNEREIQFFNEACPQVDKIYYCKQSMDKVETSKSTCIGAIFKNQTPTCHLDEMEMTPSVYQPREKLIILTNVPKTLIKHNCRSENQTTIEGTALIHFNKCNVEVNGVTYTDNVLTFWDNAKILLPPQLNITSKSITASIKLPKLQEYSFKYNSSILALQEENAVISTTTTITIIIFGILILLTIVLATTKRTQIIYETTVAPASPASFWPSLYSKGGGVTYAPHTPPTISSTKAPLKPKRSISTSVPTPD